MYYSIERMMKSVLSKGGKVNACGTCVDTRGTRKVSLIEGAECGAMSEPAQLTVIADKVFTL